jgi:hypothetical protein
LEAREHLKTLVVKPSLVEARENSEENSGEKLEIRRILGRFPKILGGFLKFLNLWRSL